MRRRGRLGPDRASPDSGARPGGLWFAASGTGPPGRPAARARRIPGGSTFGAWGFVLRFAALWALALGIISRWPAVDRWAVEVTVANVVWVLRRVSMDTSVAQNSIFAGGAEIQIIPDCTPLMPTLVLWAAVAAFPARWHYKVLGLLVGAAAVWAFNLLRVFALMAVLAWMPQHFKFVHVYLWQTGTLLVVIALFVLWIQTESRVPAPG